MIRPKWGFHWEEVQRRGVDILIALDVSTSMLAEDVSPNRLDRAKRKISDLLKIIQGDRVGLIAFAGTAFLQCPLTLDHGAIAIFLDSIDTDLIPVPGTAIGQAIELALKAFESSPKNSRALILITDGEDTTGNPLEVAKKANEQGVKIYTIGIGKEGGVPIPDGKQGGFKKDRKGEVVLTHLDEQSLQKIALETGGSYVRSVSGDLDLDKVYEDIQKKTEDKELKSGRQRRYEERYQWPLFLALLCLILEVLMSERIREVRSQRIFVPRLFKKTRISLLLFFLSSIGGATAFSSSGEKNYKKGDYQGALKEFLDAQINSPNDLILKYNSANAYYKLNQFQEAEKLYSQVASAGDPTISQRAIYNLGNTAYRQGKLEQSLSFYQKALELDPKDEDAKFNIEFVKKEIQRRIEENKKNPQGQPPPKSESAKQENKGSNPKEEAGKKEEKPPTAEQASGRPMSKEEAEQWLSSLQEDRKKFNHNSAEGPRQYQVEKDW